MSKYQIIVIILDVICPIKVVDECVLLLLLRNFAKRILYSLVVEIFFLPHKRGLSLTCDSLMRKGYALVGWCYMCRCNGELVDHLLLPCSRVALWSNVFCSFGIQWVLAGWVRDLLFGWRNWFGKHSSDIWNVVPFCLM